jgi:hypothetical protein
MRRKTDSRSRFDHSLRPIPLFLFLFLLGVAASMYGQCLAGTVSMPAVCGTSHLTVVGAAHFAAPGFLYVEEESEMSPRIMATVTAVQ